MQNTQGKRQYCCSRCYHITLVDIKTEEIAKSQKQADINRTTLYNTQQIFNIGDSTLHSGWNDRGKVLNKTFTSNSSQAIIVSFEKERRTSVNFKYKLFIKT